MCVCVCVCEREREKWKESPNSSSERSSSSESERLENRHISTWIGNYFNTLTDNVGKQLKCQLIINVITMIRKSSLGDINQNASMYFCSSLTLFFKKDTNVNSLNFWPNWGHGQCKSSDIRNIHTLIKMLLHLIITVLRSCLLLSGSLTGKCKRGQQIMSIQMKTKGGIKCVFWSCYVFVSLI